MSDASQPPAPDAGWLILIYRVPSEPTRLRAAVWRRLKELGAIYLPSTLRGRSGTLAVAVGNALVGAESAAGSFKAEQTEQVAVVVGDGESAALVFLHEFYRCTDGGGPALIRRLVADGVPRRQVARQLGIGRPTIDGALASDRPPK